MVQNGTLTKITIAIYITMFQIGEEVAKLLELKAQLGDDGPKKFVLKTPKVTSFVKAVI